MYDEFSYVGEFSPPPPQFFFFSILLPYPTPCPPPPLRPSSQARAKFEAEALAKAKNDPEKVKGLYDSLEGGHVGVFRDLLSRKEYPGATPLTGFCGGSGSGLCSASHE